MIRLVHAFILSLAFIGLFAGCGGSSSDGPAFVGTWELTMDNDVPVSQLNFRQEVTLTTTTYSGWIESGSMRCEWDGTITYTDTTITSVRSTVTGPCAFGADLSPRTGTWNVTGNTLTLDGSSHGSGVQTYKRK